MTKWADRPVEEARLLNPAFVAALLLAAAGDYARVAGQPMPWTLTFLIPPLVLPASSREVLPSNTRAHFANWVQQHPDVRLAFAQRAKAVVPIVREALRVGLRTDALRIEGASLQALVQPRPEHQTSLEVRDCFRAARFVGRWFAGTSDVPTVFALLGVRP